MTGTPTPITSAEVSAYSAERALVTLRMGDGPHRFIVPWEAITLTAMARDAMGLPREQPPATEPLPEAALETTGPLNADQEARVAALKAAREALRTGGGLTAANPLDATDLADLAEFILSGRNPSDWARTTDTDKDA